MTVPTPPVATLRAAAEAIRERAEAALVVGWDHLGGGRVAGWVDGYGEAVVCDAYRKSDAEHIASWHPAVALAVADWLEQVATGWEDRAADFAQGGRFAGLGTWEPPTQHPALTVARTYLGGDQ